MIAGHNALRRRVARVLVVLQFASIGAPAFANPRGGTVVSGAASITDAGAVTTITQGTDRAIINWQGFSNAAGETVRFQQPSTTSATLNRVTGPEASVMNGAMNANGRVFLINPNGVIFGKTATVNTAGLVASTLDMADDDFRSGNYKLKQDPTRPLGAVVNQGRITTPAGGSVVLVAPVVSNEGTITAPSGRVALLAGTRATVTLDPQGLVTVGVNEDVAGSAVVPRAAVSGMLEQVVNNRDLVSAGSVVTSANGEITLGGAEGLAVNAGKIDVSAAAGRHAGSVRVEGARVAVAAPGSIIHANGVGASSNGGDVRVISPGTMAFAPSARIEAKGGTSGDGGFVEVSGHQKVFAKGRADTSAADGKRGTFLIDPATITIVDGAAGSGALDDDFCNGQIGFGTCCAPNTVTVNQIVQQSQTSDVVLQATSSIVFENSQCMVLGAGTGCGANITFQVGACGTISKGAVACVGDVRASFLGGNITFTGGANSDIDLRTIDLFACSGSITINAGRDVTMSQVVARDSISVTAGRDILQGNSRFQLDAQANVLSFTAGGRIACACAPLVTCVFNTLNLTLTGAGGAFIENAAVSQLANLNVSAPSTANVLDIVATQGFNRVTLNGGVLCAPLDRTNFTYTAQAGCLTVNSLGGVRCGNLTVTVPGVLNVKAISTLGDVTLTGAAINLQPCADGLVVGNNVRLNACGNVTDGNGTGSTGSTNVVGLTSVTVNVAFGSVQGNYHTPNLIVTAGCASVLDACVKLGAVTVSPTFGSFLVASNSNIVDNNGAAVNVTANLAAFQAGGTIGSIGDPGIELAANVLQSKSNGSVAYRDASTLNVRICTGGAGTTALQVCAGALSSNGITTPAVAVKGCASVQLQCFTVNAFQTIAYCGNSADVRFGSLTSMTIGDVSTVLGCFSGIRSGGTGACAKIFLISMDGMSQLSAIDAPNMTVFLGPSAGVMSQTGANAKIVADKLQLQPISFVGGNPDFQLCNPANDVNQLAVCTSGGGAGSSFRDLDDVQVASVSTFCQTSNGIRLGSGNFTLRGTSIDVQAPITAPSLRLNATCAVTQAATGANIVTPAVALQSTGSFTLTAAGNNIQNVRSCGNLASSVSVNTSGNLSTFGAGVSTNNGAIALSANTININNGSPIDAGSAKVSLTARTSNITGNGALDVTAGSAELIATAGRVLGVDLDLTGAGPVFARIGAVGGATLNLTGTAPSSLKMQVANTAQNFRVTRCGAFVDSTGNVLSGCGTQAFDFAYQAAAGALCLGPLDFSTHTLTLTTVDDVSQSGALLANQLLVRNATENKDVNLTDAGNAIGTFAANVRGNVTVNVTGALSVGSVTPVQDACPVAVNGITTTGDGVSLTSGSTIGGLGLITAAGVILTGAGQVSAALAANCVQALSSGGCITLTNNPAGLTGLNLTAATSIDYRQCGNALALIGTVTAGSQITIENGGAIELVGSVTGGSGLTKLTSKTGNISGTATIAAPSVELSGQTGVQALVRTPVLEATAAAGAIAIDNAPTAGAVVTSLAAGGAVRYTQSTAFDTALGAVSAGGALCVCVLETLSLTGAATAGGNATARARAINLNADFTSAADAALIATGGAILGTGRLTAVTGALTASTAIGSAAQSLATSLGTLTATASQGLFLNETDALGLNALTAAQVTLTAGGALTDNNGAALNIAAADATLTAASIGSAADALEMDLGLASLNARALAGGIFASDPNDLGLGTLTATDAISIFAGGVLRVGSVRGTTVTLAAGGNLDDGNAALVNVTANSARLTAGGTIGNASDALDVVLVGPLFVDASGTTDNTAVNLAGTIGDGSLPQILDGVLEARGFFNDVQFFPRVNTRITVPDIVTATIALSTVGRVTLVDAPTPPDATSPEASPVDASRFQSGSDVDAVNPFKWVEEDEEKKKRRR